MRHPGGDPNAAGVLNRPEPAPPVRLHSPGAPIPPALHGYRRCTGALLPLHGHRNITPSRCTEKGCAAPRCTEPPPQCTEPSRGAGHSRRYIRGLRQGARPRSYPAVPPTHSFVHTPPPRSARPGAAAAQVSPAGPHRIASPVPCPAGRGPCARPGLPPGAAAPMTGLFTPGRRVPRRRGERRNRPAR